MGSAIHRKGESIIHITTNSSSSFLQKTNCKTFIVWQSGNHEQRVRSPYSKTKWNVRNITINYRWFLADVVTDRKTKKSSWRRTSCNNRRGESKAFDHGRGSEGIGRYGRCDSGDDEVSLLAINAALVFVTDCQLL